MRKQLPDLEEEAKWERANGESESPDPRSKTSYGVAKRAFHSASLVLALVEKLGFQRLMGYLSFKRNCIV